MRILMTCDTYGGVFTYAAELSRALALQGVEVALCACGKPLDDAQHAALRGIAGLQLFSFQGALEWMDDPWEDVSAAGRWLLGLAEELQPDCVHLNEYSHASLPWCAPVLVVGHSCVLSWWEAVLREPAPARYDRYRENVRAGLAAASCVVAPSGAMKRALCTHYGPLPVVHVIPNGIDLRAFRPQPKRAQVFSAGRFWDAAKNLATLQRTAAALDWPVYVAGELEAPSGERLDAAPCRLLGRVSRAQLAEQLGQAAIYALPARYEPFGLSVLEAAASGCALVLGRAAGLVENWAGAACFVDPDDARALERALRELIAQPSMLHMWSERARLRAQGFSAERMAKSYLELYRASAAAYGAKESVRCAS